MAQCVSRGNLTAASCRAAVHPECCDRLTGATLCAACARRGHVFLNQGIGGTTSTIFAACHDQLVPPDADLVSLEFTLNDEKAGGYDRPSRRAFEQLLRLLLRPPAPPAAAPAVILLHHYAWGAAGKVFWFPPEAQLSTFAQVRAMWGAGGAREVSPLQLQPQLVLPSSYPSRPPAAHATVPPAPPTPATWLP